MSDDLTVRVLREIQSELADMRDDRTVLKVDALPEGIHSFSSELRALRSQLDRFRNEVREGLRDIGNRLDALETRSRVD